MAAPVLLWCATAVALLTTLAGATETARGPRGPRGPRELEVFELKHAYTIKAKQDMWGDEAQVKKYKRLSKSIQRQYEQISQLRPPWPKEENSKAKAKENVPSADAVHASSAAAYDPYAEFQKFHDVQRRNDSDKLQAPIDQAQTIWLRNLELQIVLQRLTEQLHHFRRANALLSNAQIYPPNPLYPNPLYSNLYSNALREQLASLSQHALSQLPENESLKGMNQDKKNALKPSPILAMPGLILLVFPLAILFLYMIHSKSKERNVNYKD